MGNICHHISYQASLLLLQEFCRSLLLSDQSLLWCKNLVKTSSDLIVMGHRRSIDVKMFMSIDDGVVASAARCVCILAMSCLISPHACSQPTDTIIQWVVNTIKLHLEVIFILFLGSTDSIKNLIYLIFGVDFWY